MTSSLEISFYETTNRLGIGGYLVMPFHPLTLRSAIDHVLAVAPVAIAPRDTHLFIRGTRNKHIRIEFNDILYLYSERNYTFIKTSDSLHIIKRSLVKMQQELDTRFLRVHNSYIVNTVHIKSIASLTVLIFDKEIVPLGRAYRKSLTNKLKNMFITG